MLLDDDSIGNADDLTEFEADQLVAALAADGTVVADAGAGIAALDGPLRAVKFWDLTNEAGIDLLSYRLGDTASGAFFVSRTTTIVARLNDGDVIACDLGRGNIGSCASVNDCDAEHLCQGARENAPGRCVPRAALNGEGETCVDVNDCNVGLRCDSFDSCTPAYNAGTFAVAGLTDTALALPAGQATSLTLTVSGLATVSTDVQLSTFIFAEAGVASLDITLTNPVGTSVPLFVDNVGNDITFDGAVFGYPGDESVNGEWTLTIDNTSTSIAEIREFMLRIGSRLD